MQPRTTIALPRAHFEQLNAIVHRRGLASPAALIDEWITRAVGEGEIDPPPPEFSVQHFAGGMLISIREHVLPIVSRERARVLATVLSAAGGEPEAALGFVMPTRGPVVLDFDGGKLAIGRAGPGGRGVRIVWKQSLGSEGIRFAFTPRQALDFARLIRAEFGEQ